VRSAHAAIACLLLLPAGCAAPGVVAGPPRSARAERPPDAAAASPASAQVVLEVRLRRSAELVDTRGDLRVFDQDLRVEYRAGGKGAGSTRASSRSMACPFSASWPARGA
jgi:hypothetical protein